MTHSRYVNELLMALSKIDGVTVKKNVVGKFRKLYTDEIVTVGHKGEADITGFAKCKLSTVAIHLEIECKTGTGRLSKQQGAWRDHVLSTGAYYYESRNIQETLDDLILFLNNH